ncbi:glycoside-pentoside-hexuronide (GPH):cation symporter [Bifidobacterium choloepi]|uniref:MFS transporter n=1 Tax=Bifidobacterium choloepi TaxID=2614131 RepID=A0A6I5MXY7_9BIFI|nr:glycoside-pentoside-hexuronide (GPH):cation symporter [Bifidobacterium choloepi]NEG69458.1 MFS transporter [Bifidobacterium choloepi]
MQEASQQTGGAVAAGSTGNGTGKKVNYGRRVAYAFGNLGQAALYNALSTYFVVYVTSAMFAGVDQALATKMIGIITGLIVVIRIAEIFIDPLLGNLVDNTTTRLGRFRPWQLIGGISSAVLLMIVYTGLFGLVNVSEGWFIVLFVVAFIVLDVFYSLRDISYWGMIPALSEDSHERSVYTSLGSFTGSIGYNGITVVVVPLVSFFTYKFTGQWTEGQSGWSAFGVIVGIFGILTALSVAFGTKESDSALRQKAQKNGNPIQAFAAIAKNDQLLWVALSYLLYAIANVATTGVLFYLFKFVLGMPDAFSIAGVVPIVIGLIAAPAYPVLNRVIPRKFLYVAGCVFMIGGYLLFIFGSKSLPVIVVALVLFYIPGTLIQMTAILCLTDSIEYGQLKTGRRNEAVTLSVRPMLDKIAGAFSNGIVGFIAVAAGMTGTATAADMTASNIHTFSIFAYYIPLALIVLSLIVFLTKVRIDEKEHARIVRELEKELADGELVEEAVPDEGADLTEAPVLAENPGIGGAGRAA